MAHPGCALRGSALLMACSLLGLAAAPVPAKAGTVAYFHDFLGATCIREEDLETAYREGFKGTRPPPLCIEQPCAELLDRSTYEREILGREATGEEWQSYLDTRETVCTSADPDSMARLLPAPPPAGPAAVTRAAFSGGFDLGGPVTPWQEASAPGYGSHQVDRPAGQRSRSDPDPDRLRLAQPGQARRDAERPRKQSAAAPWPGQENAQPENGHRWQQP
ncbi:hypothetical protein [Mangrovicoccus ximenensis]|uniref:hypothetical protein n=1 Tax=Mangrovicoccus ximenensis TaxID=1911570 RepID=UPI0011AE878B|nr:hypothetical protein [Mangrovicoccus ximenensis]